MKSVAVELVLEYHARIRIQFRTLFKTTLLCLKRWPLRIRVAYDFQTMKDFKYLPLFSLEPRFQNLSLKASNTQALPLLLFCPSL